MRIVVCVKQVPDAREVSIDPETKRLVRENVKSALNPFDYYALEEALLLSAGRGEVIALSMGPPAAANALRECLAIGADRAVLLSDAAFGGSDTWATSYALAAAIRSIGSVSLVLCGRQAIDGDTAQVGPGIAAHLGWQQAACVSDAEELSESHITVRRMLDTGYDRCRLGLPAVLSVVKGINEPRVPTLTGVLASRLADIPVLKPADIGADADKIGLFASPTRVVRTAPPEARIGGTERIEGGALECARVLADRILAIQEGAHAAGTV